MEPNNNAPVQGPVLAPLLEAPIWRDFAVLTYSNHVRHVAPGVSSFHLVAEARVGFLRKFWNRTCPACGWLFHLGVWTLGLIVSHLLVARAPTRRDSRSSTKTKQHVGKPNENVVLGGWNHDGHEMKWNFSKVLNQICRYAGLNPNWFPEFFLGEIFDLMRDQIDISFLIRPLLYYNNYMAALDIPLKQNGLSPTKAFWDSVPNHPVKRWPSDLDILQVSKKMILLGPTFQKNGPWHLIEPPTWKFSKFTILLHPLALQALAGRKALEFGWHSLDVR